MEYQFETSGKNAGQSLVLTRETDIMLAELIIAIKQGRTEIKRLASILKVIAENVDNGDPDRG